MTPWLRRTMVRSGSGHILRLTTAQCEVHEPMQYLPLFLLLAAVLIAAYFYLERAKKRTPQDETPAAQESDAPQP
jgi:hypothetical protein